MDLDVKQYSIEHNAAIIDYIMNSHGGYPKGSEPTFNAPTNPRPDIIPTLPAPSKPADWALWNYVKAWIVKGIRDQILNENTTTWHNYTGHGDAYNHLKEVVQLCKISHVEDPWFDGIGNDTYQWYVGGDRVILKDISMQFILHGGKKAKTDYIGGYYTSGWAGFHTNNWLFVGGSSNTPYEDEDIQYNLRVDGRSLFNGKIRVKNELNCTGATVKTSSISFGEGGALVFADNGKISWQQEEKDPSTGETSTVHKETTITMLTTEIEAVRSENAALKETVNEMQTKLDNYTQIVADYEERIARLEDLTRHFASIYVKNDISRKHT